MKTEDLKNLIATMQTELQQSLNQANAIQSEAVERSLKIQGGINALGALWAEVQKQEAPAPEGKTAAKKAPAKKVTPISKKAPASRRRSTARKKK